jgi:hypothetical protein
MGQHTSLFVEAVFPGEVAALRRPTHLSKDIFNGTSKIFSTGIFARYSISYVNDIPSAT